MSAERDPRVEPMAGDVLRGPSGVYRHVVASTAANVAWRWSLHVNGRSALIDFSSLDSWRSRWAAGARVIRRGDAP